LRAPSSFEEISALNPQQPQDIPRGMEIGKKYGLEILPPGQEILS